MGLWPSMSYNWWFLWGYSWLELSTYNIYNWYFGPNRVGFLYGFPWSNLLYLEIPAEKRVGSHCAGSSGSAQVFEVPTSMQKDDQLIYKLLINNFIINFTTIITTIINDYRSLIFKFTTWWLPRNLGARRNAPRFCGMSHSSYAQFGHCVEVVRIYDWSIEVVPYLLDQRFQRAFRTFFENSTKMGLSQTVEYPKSAVLVNLGPSYGEKRMPPAHHRSQPVPRKPPQNGILWGGWSLPMRWCDDAILW